MDARPWRLCASIGALLVPGAWWIVDDRSYAVAVATTQGWALNSSGWKLLFCLPVMVALVAGIGMGILIGLFGKRRPRVASSPEAGRQTGVDLARQLAKAREEGVAAEALRRDIAEQRIREQAAREMETLRGQLVAVQGKLAGARASARRKQHKSVAK